MDENLKVITDVGRTMVEKDKEAKVSLPEINHASVYCNNASVYCNHASVY